MRAFINILLIASICFSCNSPQKEIGKLVKKWQGKEIILPQKIEFKILGRDTICTDLWDKPYKILTYIDSVGCLSCQMGLPFGEEIIGIFMREKYDVPILFVIHSNNYHLLSRELIATDFNYPVIYDDNNLFDKLNHFPPAPYRTFLLDKNNKIILIGSPIDNSPIWELYKDIISKPL
jgi:hypothetical protein